MTNKEKLTEATILALQGKLAEDNQNVNKSEIINWFKQCDLIPEYNKNTGTISCIYLNNRISIVKNSYGTYYINYAPFIYISDEVNKLITKKDVELYSSDKLGKKYYNLVNDIANDFYYKYPELDDKKIYNTPITNENGLELIRYCKDLVNKTVDIVNKNLAIFVENTKMEIKNKSSKSKLKYNIVYYLNTAARERREETEDDVDNDYCDTVEYFNTDLEAFEYIIYDILEMNPEDLYENLSESDDEKIKDIIHYFENQDYGDGEVIICKVIGKNYKYDSGLSKNDFLDMVS